MAISRADRARQFLPFDALKGLQEELRKKEIEYEDKKELSEERLEELSDILSTIEKDDTVRITYYINRQYKDITGKIKKVRGNDKKIILYGDIKINFIDVLNIKKIS